jgi:hypothetical protein
MTEPPVTIAHHGRFHTGADARLPDEPGGRTYQKAAKRLAFRALTSGKLAAQLFHVFRAGPAGSGATGEQRVMGGWLIADCDGNVTAHRGQYVGQGGPWDLANAIIPGSAQAVQPPMLNGYYRARPEAYLDMVERHAASLLCLQGRHGDAVDAGYLYAVMQIRAEPGFLPLLRAAIDDRATQLILHDWLAEHNFPHVDELRSKRWNQGKWTENQLLDLLSKRFATTRRSFSGRTV